MLREAKPVLLAFNPVAVINPARKSPLPSRCTIAEAVLSEVDPCAVVAARWVSITE
jgi:hypothetical protein